MPCFVWLDNGRCNVVYTCVRKGRHGQHIALNGTIKWARTSYLSIGCNCSERKRSARDTCSTTRDHEIKVNGLWYGPIKLISALTAHDSVVHAIFFAIARGSVAGKNFLSFRIMQLMGKIGRPEAEGLWIPPLCTDRGAHDERK